MKAIEIRKNYTQVLILNRLLIPLNFILLGFVLFSDNKETISVITASSFFIYFVTKVYLSSFYIKINLNEGDFVRCGSLEYKVTSIKNGNLTLERENKNHTLNPFTNHGDRLRLFNYFKVKRS